MAMKLERRRFHGLFNAQLVLMLSVVVFGLISHLLTGMAWQVDISSEGWSRLEEETASALAELEKSGVSIQVIGFSHQARHRERDAVVSDLLLALAGASATPLWLHAASLGLRIVIHR